MIKRQNLAGFTLLELMIVVAVIGILASIAVPTYIKVVERARSKEGISNLMIIRAAERIYRLENGTYYASGLIDEINSNLNIDIDENLFTYTISATATTFTATATRINEGPCANQNMFITESLTEPDTIACTFW